MPRGYFEALYEVFAMALVTVVIVGGTIAVVLHVLGVIR